MRPLFHASCWPALVLVISGCHSGGPAVEQFGQMKAVMREGQTEPRAALAAFGAGTDWYAVGALAGLAGEVTVVGGEVWVARVSGGACAMTGPAASAADSATLLTAARVQRWSSHTLTEAVEGTALDDAIARLSRAQGLAAPFPFVIECERPTVELHVVNGFCPHGAQASPDAPQPWRWAGVPEASARFVGFFAPGSEGVMTHHGTAVHVHAVLTIDSHVVAGHVDQLAIPKGATIRLPAP